MTVELRRNDKSTEAVLGELFVFRGAIVIFSCKTLEDMWRNNQRDNPNTPEAEESCIPKGEYKLRRRISAKYGVTPYVIGTQPERDLILVHKGNSVEDTLGCVLVGTNYGRIKSRFKNCLLDSVTRSGVAFEGLMAALESSEEWKSGKDIDFKIV